MTWNEIQVQLAKMKPSEQFFCSFEGKDNLFAWIAVRRFGKEPKYLYTINPVNSVRAMNITITDIADVFFNMVNHNADASKWRWNDEDLS